MTGLLYRVYYCCCYHYWTVSQDSGGIWRWLHWFLPCQNHWCQEGTVWRNHRWPVCTYVHSCDIWITMVAIHNKSKYLCIHSNVWLIQQRQVWRSYHMVLVWQSTKCTSVYIHTYVHAWCLTTVYSEGLLCFSSIMLPT